jgi:hypothetical protein
MKFCVKLGVTLMHADRHVDMTQLMLSPCDVPEKYDGSVLSSTANILCFFTLNDWIWKLSTKHGRKVYAKMWVLKKTVYV